MINFELAQIFYRIADFLELKEVEFKPQAYENAARSLEMLDRDAKDIYEEDGLRGLEKIPGVGKSIAKKIEEYIKTGKIKYYKKLKKQCPVDVEELMGIEGLGPRKIKLLYRKLKIKNLKDLEKAAEKGKIRKLEGFGQRSEENILQGITFAKATKGRFLLGAILPVIREIINELEKLPEVRKISAAGSIRRMKETIGDSDILIVSSKPKKVMDFFCSMPGVVKVWAKGPTRASVRLKSGFDCDLRVIKEESFGAALQYFTGNKDHNIVTRRIAIKKRLKLNEYGVFKGKKKIAGRTEKGVYQAIGLAYIEPEMRTNTGEIEAALENNLPKVISYGSIKGDCQCHTDWSDGAHTIEEMAKAAKKLGYEYLVISDHLGKLKIAGALNRRSILKQMKEIDKINKRVPGIKLLKGCEIDIRKDGRLDIEDDVLEKLDLVLAAVHSSFKMSKKDMTKRLVKAIENPYVNVIVHPTGRVIFRRKGYEFDFDRIFKMVKKNKVALEINAHPTRLDLRDADIRQAVKNNVKLIISTDAHSANGLSTMELGIGMARRGWAEKKDILNTKSYKELLSFFK